MAEPKSFTGRGRRRSTRWSVYAADVVSRTLIRVGGIGTIVAVSLVCLFLAWVVGPLFLSASLNDQQSFHVPWKAYKPLHFAVDEHQSIGWSLAADGVLRVFRADSGDELEVRRLFAGPALTATSFELEGNRAAFGFEDGSVRLGRIGFATQFFEREQVTEEIRQIADGTSAPYRNGMIQRTPQGQYRLQTIHVEISPAIKVAGSAVQLIDSVTGSRPAFCVYTAEGRLLLNTVVEKLNFASGAKELKVDQTVELPLPQAPETQPTHLLLSGRGETVYLAWKSGRLLRLDARTLKKPTLAEEIEIVDAGSTLTAMGLLLGGTTVIVGDSAGRLDAWFPARRDDATASDGLVLVRAHRLPASGSAVTSLFMSARTRMLAAGFQDGRVGVFHVTSNQRLVQATVAGGEPVVRVFLASKDDGLYAATSKELSRWALDPKHPEASMTSLFRSVWYEGYNEPSHAWQSSGGSEDLEPKFGLMPLIFGSIKATFYSMLFGAPLALLAAVYTSEFLHPRNRARIKPTIELMASLPSVVLGFLAALVFAPYVENIVPAVLACLVAVPVTMLLGAHFWQMLPYRTSILWSRYRFMTICVTFPLGILAGAMLGPLVERLLFAGDIKRWLDGQIGSGTGAWVMLFLPLSGLSAACVSSKSLNPWLRGIAADWSRPKCALVELLKFAAMLALTVGTALAISVMLTAAGFDPRGSYVATYMQRNALVVGFVMGFAVIPIIYTIAEDSLSSVPDHLRWASLGCGATPWQTAVNIVIPAGMSGLFSALMIGLGRAVGETMIVLMAGGNTPITNWNIFNGFRTLSANIAVELPEAVRNSTHYRTLFLAALSLFLLTFVVNTAAEIVRLRFRKRIVEL